jgi:hypothetical protein
MSNIGVEEPDFTDLPDEYSPEVWDTAWIELEKSYTHAKIVYQLKDDENMFVEILKGLTGMTDGFAMASYGSHTFAIPAPDAQATAEAIVGGTGSQIASIRAPVEELHEQDRADFPDWLQRLSSSLGDLEWNSDEAYLRGQIGAVLDDLDEDNWDSDLAKEVRDRAILKIERAMTWVWNTGTFLHNHLVFYDGVLLESRQQVYAHLLQAINGLKDIAELVEASMKFDFSKFTDFYDQLKAATAKDTGAMERISAVKDLVDNAKTTNEENGIADPDTLLDTLSEQAGKSLEYFDQALDSGKAELNDLISTIATTPLADLTLPEADSLF